MFITEEYLKKVTPVGEGVNASQIRPWIDPAKVNLLDPILGEYYLERLAERVQDEETTQADEEILKRIRPVQAWGVAKYLVFGTSLKMKNKGIQKQFGDFSESADAEEVRFMADEYLHNIKNYQSALRKFVKKNIKKYPEITDKKNEDAELFGCGCVDSSEDGYFSDSFMIV